MRSRPLVTLEIATRRRCEIVDLTPEVQRLVRASGIVEGLAVVVVPHTTAGVTVNENADPDVKADLLEKLERLIPRGEAFYRHAEGNSDSHLKASLTGGSATLLIEAGRLLLGQWQGIHFCEFDGPRRRQAQVKLIAFDAG